jgi:hypothetical protein
VMPPRDSKKPLPPAAYARGRVKAHTPLGRGQGRVSGSRLCTASEIASATSDE